jgi:Tat protein secretion system quality control protein TatD with DNase activity
MLLLQPLGGRNTPDQLRLAVEQVAIAQKRDYAEVEQIVNNNAKRLFRLD